VPRVVELAGGVGGAKLADGLQAVVGRDLTVVVNTGDDLERHGLAIWPDHDTVAYTLAGLDDEERGWGLADETWTVIDTLAARGEDAWFRIGDRDIATHLVRTERLRRGERPTQVARALGTSLGVAATVMPMTDDAVRTEVRTPDGWLDFQEYFVHRGQRPDVLEVRFRGIESARITPEAKAAIEAAEIIVIAPSNPIVSIGPVLAVPGVRAAVEARRADVVAVSPIVAGAALKGPADRLLRELGHEATVVGVARLYAPLAATLVVDDADADHAPAVEAEGLRCVVAPTIMRGPAEAAALGRTVLSA
jgi:LPPG:FO 2-phospho-L-lactate transferase